MKSNVYFYGMEKETKIYGIRAIMEAIEAENAIDKVFLQKGLSGDLFAALEKLLRKQNINFLPNPSAPRLPKIDSSLSHC